MIKNQSYCLMVLIFFNGIFCINYFLNSIMKALLLMHVVWGIRFRIKWMINLKD